MGTDQLTFVQFCKALGRRGILSQCEHYFLMAPAYAHVLAHAHALSAQYD